MPLPALPLALLALAEAPPLPPGEIFKRVAPSVVVVLALSGDGAVTAQGSGVVVARDTVVTNRHVVEGAARVRVQWQGHGLPARVARLDAERDLARLRVGRLRAPPASLRPSDSLEVGERVYTVGAPQGLDLSLSEGLVSRLKPDRDAFLIQTTAPISKGSSGGGLFDSQGRLVGVTAFALREGQGLNFALPTEWITELLAAPEDDPPIRVTDIRSEAAEGGTRIVVKADGPLAYDYANPDPDHVTLELPRAVLAGAPERLHVASQEVESVLAGRGSGGSPSLVLRLVLHGPVRQRIAPRGSDLVLDFSRAQEEGRPAPSPAATTRRISAVTVEPAGDGLVVQVHADGTLSYHDFWVDSPDRLVVDFTPAVSLRPSWTQTLGSGPVRRLRLAQHAVEPEPVVRLVLDAGAPFAHRIEPLEDGIRIFASPAAAR